MKRVIIICLIVAFVFSFAGIALADGTTTLTTTVPDNVTYTLNIPENQTVDFGTGQFDINFPTISNGANFTLGKNVVVTITHDGGFKSDDVNTTIPYTVSAVPKDGSLYEGDETEFAGNSYTATFKGESDGNVKQYAYSPENPNWRLMKMRFRLNSADWGKALPGDYYSVITFSSEVVTE